MLKAFWSLITAFFMLISVAFGPTPASTESAELISEQRFVLDDLAFAGQGVTTDGKYYYTSNTVLLETQLTTIAKYKCVDGRLEPVTRRIYPLPKEVHKMGYNHMGGLTYYNNKVYACVENKDGLLPCVVAFDTENLSATDYYILEEGLEAGSFPWIAIDPDTGFLYTSGWKETDEIFIYDANNDMKYLKALKLSSTVSRVQGGEFYNGMLYLSSDTLAEGSKTCKRILKVDIGTGELSEFALRDLGIDSTEAEGMTILPAPDGSNLHVLDWNKKTMTSYIRHYKVEF